MYCIARRSVLPSLSKEQSDHLLAGAALHRLADLFEAVPDPRGVPGLRYDLPFLLTCLIAALLCNCDGTEAVAQWCRDHVALLRDTFGPRLFLTPSGSLYRWLLPQLDACAIEGVLGKWVQATTSASADEPLALDGKTVRGARSGEQAAPHLLADLVPIRVRKRSGKCASTRKPTRIPVAKQVLPTLPIRQRVWTADALPTHAEFLRLMHALGAETVLRCQRQSTHPLRGLSHLFCRSAGTLSASRDGGPPTGTHRSTQHQGQYRDECLSCLVLALCRASRSTDPHRDQGRQNHYRSRLSHHHLDCLQSQS
jgi:DDE_Tnp_1-associated